jgi:hypothetical protein
MQILSQIWQRVADQEPDYPLTIGEVFEFRRRYIGDTDTICKTLLSDIRRRNHEAMQFERRKIAASSSSNNKFVPVDKLIDYDQHHMMTTDPHHRSTSTASSLSTSSSSRRAPEREVELVEQVLRHTKLMHETKKNPEAATPEHIYDPVYGSHPSQYRRKNHHTSTNGFEDRMDFIDNNNVDLVDYSSSTAREDSLSPMIPKTVSKFCTSTSTTPSNKQYHLSSQLQSQWGQHSSLMSTPNAPIHFSKVPPPPSDPYGAQGHGDQTIIRSRRPIIQPGELYSDDYFPRVVRPTPQYQQQQKPLPAPPPSRTLAPNHQSQPDADDNVMMNAALAYRSEINNAPLTNDKKKPYLPHHTRLSSKQQQLDSSSSSTSPSSGENYPTAGGQGGHGQSHLGHGRSLEGSPWPETDQTSKRFSPGSSSPDSIIENKKKPPQSQMMLMMGPGASPIEGISYSGLNTDSSSESTSSPNLSSPAVPLGAKVPSPPKDLDLKSLDNVYYDYLLKQGHQSPSKKKSQQFNSPPPPKEEVKMLNNDTNTAAATVNVAVTSKVEDGNQPPVPAVAAKIQPWNCRHCTFKNREASKICEMCSKSQDFIDMPSDDEPEVAADVPVPKLYSVVTKSEPIDVVGTSSSNAKQVMTECPQCTLINEPQRRVCDACGFRLKPVNVTPPPSNNIY